MMREPPSNQPNPYYVNKRLDIDDVIDNQAIRNRLCRHSWKSLNKQAKGYRKHVVVFVPAIKTTTSYISKPGSILGVGTSDL